MNLNDTTSDLSVNHHFCSILSPYQVSKFGSIYMFVISNSKSLIPQSLKVVSPLRKKLIFLVSWAVKYKRITILESLEFRLQSFRAFQRYLTDNPTLG